MKIVEKSFSFLFISYDTVNIKETPKICMRLVIGIGNKNRTWLKRSADHFCPFGTVKQTRAKRRSIVNENNAADILAFAALNPYVSSGQMEKKSGISQRSVLRILHQHKFHPYRMSFYQDLYGNDFLKRVNFCN